jgi:hypothetical protein
MKKYYQWKLFIGEIQSIMVMLVRMSGDVIYDSAIQVFLNAKKEHERKGEKTIWFPIKFFFFCELGGQFPIQFQFGY